MTIEIDVLKCYFGFLGVFIDDPFDCSWKEYAIEDVANVGVRHWDQEWNWLPQMCLSDVYDIEKVLKENSPWTWF